MAETGAPPQRIPVSFRAEMPVIRARKGDSIILRSNGSEIAKLQLDSDPEFTARGVRDFDSGGVLVRVRFPGGTEVHELHFDRSQVCEVVVSFSSAP